VRENRTPGSVRGLLGDWQSYRDASQFQCEELQSEVELKRRRRIEVCQCQRTEMLTIR